MIGSPVYPLQHSNHYLLAMQHAVHHRARCLEHFDYCGKNGTCVEVGDDLFQSMRKVLSREPLLVVPNGKEIVTEPHFVGQFGSDTG